MRFGRRTFFSYLYHHIHATNNANAGPAIADLHQVLQVLQVLWVLWVPRVPRVL